MNIRYDVFDNVVYTDLNEKEYKGIVLKSNSFLHLDGVLFRKQSFQMD